MTGAEVLAKLQRLPRDAEPVAFEAGREDDCEREVDEVERRGGQVYLHLVPGDTTCRAASRLTLADYEHPIAIGWS